MIPAAAASRGNEDGQHNNCRTRKSGASPHTVQQRVILCKSCSCYSSAAQSQCCTCTHSRTWFNEESFLCGRVMLSTPLALTTVLRSCIKSLIGPLLVGFADQVSSFQTIILLGMWQDRAHFTALIVWHRLFGVMSWLGGGFSTPNTSLLNFLTMSSGVISSSCSLVKLELWSQVVTPSRNFIRETKCGLHWSSLVAFECIAMVAFVFFMRKSLSKLVSSFVGCTRHVQRT